MKQHNELDWFEFETRMRNVVSLLIDPLIKNIEKNTSNIELMKKSGETTNKKIRFIESLVGTPNSKTGWIEEIECRLNSLSLEIKLNAEKSNQNIFEMKEKLENAQVSLKELQANVESFEKQIKLYSNQMVQSQENLQEYSQKFAKDLQKTNEDLNGKIDDLNLLMTECNRLSDQANRKSLEVSQKTNENFQHIDKMRLMMREQAMQMIQLVHEKATTDDFMKFSISIDAKVEAALEKMRVCDNKVQQAIRYIDNYLPFDTQIYISDNLYSFLPKRQLRVWMKFEEQRRKELIRKVMDFESINDIDKIVEATLKNIKIFENRKDDIYYKMIRRNLNDKTFNSDSSSSSENSLKKNRKFAALTMRPEPVPQANIPEFDKEILDKIHAAKDTLSRMDGTVKYIQSNHATLKSYVENSVEEVKVHVQVLENTINSYKKDEADKASAIFLSFSDKLDTFKHKLKNCYDAIVNLSELVSALVEFALVTNAIQDQEEKDKKDSHKQNSDVHLPPVTMRKHSIGQSEYFSGKVLNMKSQNSIPQTPLQYKNVLYTREELIELIGRVISRAWTECSGRPPYLAKTLRQAATSQNLNTTLNISSSQIKP